MDIKQAVTQKMKEVFLDDQRRINHAMKVLHHAEEIAKTEGLDANSSRIVTITAILHDIGIKASENKYNSSAARYQEIEGPPVARRILEELGVEEAVIERVCYIIGGHHTASKINGPDFQIIWEADLLVNIQEKDAGISLSDKELLIKKNFKTALGEELARKLF